MDVELTIRDGSFDDWYLIERKHHDGHMWMEPTGPNSAALMCSSRISDADVEGYRSEMLALADAIERRDFASFKRCAVDARTPQVRFWSPRNSQRPGVVSLATADALAAEIRTKLATEPPHAD